MPRHVPYQHPRITLHGSVRNVTVEAWSYDQGRDREFHIDVQYPKGHGWTHITLKVRKPR